MTCHYFACSLDGVATNVVQYPYSTRVTITMTFIYLDSFQGLFQYISVILASCWAFLRKYFGIYARARFIHSPRAHSYHTNTSIVY